MTDFKKRIKVKFPYLYTAVKRIPIFADRFRSKEKVFNKIYRNNLWRTSESASGPGSIIEHTTKFLEELVELFKELKIKSLLDAGCGDFNWMKEIQLNGISYTGADVVKELVENNTKLYAGSNVKFMRLDMRKGKLPSADLIICRDTLVHYPYRDIFLTLKNFKKSSSGYLLTTTFRSLENNEDIVTGGWRELNFRLPPFNFPEPLRVIYEYDEINSAKQYDKCLALWKLEDINI